MVARDLGITPNRNGKALSPFNNEKTPSFQLYPDTNSFYCYSTNQGGTVIDLVMNYYKISPLEAVKLLNDRYNLHIDISSPANKKEIAEIKQNQNLRNKLSTYKSTTLDKLLFCIRTYRKWQKEYAPINSYDEPAEPFIQAISNIDRVEFLYDELNTLSDDNIITFFMSYNEEVTRYALQCRREICTGNGRR